MKDSERSAMMHAVLDGEATPGEARELERILAADPAARAEFEELRRLFEGLAGVAKVFPPEGLVASVMEQLPRPATPTGGSSQLSSPSGVIGQDSKGAQGNRPGSAATVHRVSQPGPFFRGENMSENKSGSFSKRSVWIGVGIAAVAAVIAVAVDFPPNGKDTAGTIFPAQRYRATQNAASDVKLGEPSSPQSGQTSPGVGIAGGQNAAVANQNVSNEVRQQSVSNEVRYQGVTNELKQQGLNNEVMQQAVTNEAAKQQAVTNQVMKQAVTNEAVKQQAVTNQVMKQAVTNQAMQQAVTNQVMQQAVTNQSRIQ